MGGVGSLTGRLLRSAAWAEPCGEPHRQTPQVGGMGGALTSSHIEHNNKRAHAWNSIDADNCFLFMVLL